MRSVTVLLALLSAASAAAQDPLCELDELWPVFFAHGSAELAPPSPDPDFAPGWRLTENLSVFQLCPELRVVATGANDGTEASGGPLAWRRAEAVARWYLAAGLPPSRVAVASVGTHPDAFPDGDPGPGDASARRADSVPRPAADPLGTARPWPSYALDRALDGLLPFRALHATRRSAARTCADASGS